MRRLVWGLAWGLAWGLTTGSAAAQQVWKCEVDGTVVYTDQPCEKAGRPLPPRNLQGHVIDAPAAPAAGAAPEAAERPAAAASAASEPATLAQVGASAPARVGRQFRRGGYMPKVAMNGLMDTDFVLRGYMLRRPRPTATPEP